jgi:DNA-binding NarL/FixJ family response regulator
VAGDEHAALDTADAAEAATIAVEARGLSAFARAISHCRAGSPREETSVRHAFEQAARAQNVDGLVSAYRAYPPLLERIWQHCGKAEFLFEAIERAGDISLARAAKLPVAPREGGGGGLLSAREKEILELIRQGLTNAEIAQALFLSVSTVKVHVRHIFEKLGVRTRAEAASLQLE